MSTETKDRLALRMRPETRQKIEQWYEADNCRSKNEFVEKAVNFYADYLAAGSCSTLPASVLSAIDGRLGMFEDRMAKLLYKQAVEMDIGNGILADVCRLSEEDMRRRRGESVQNVKQTRGSIPFEKRMRDATADFEPEYDEGFQEWRD